MNTVLYLRYMARESRGSIGRLVFFTTCLSVGVAAVVAVAGLSGGLEEAIRVEARKLLAADLVVESLHTLPQELPEKLESLPAQAWTTVKEMPTVVVIPRRSTVMVIPLALRTTVITLASVASSTPRSWAFATSAQSSPTRSITRARGCPSPRVNCFPDGVWI